MKRLLTVLLPIGALVAAPIFASESTETAAPAAADAKKVSSACGDGVVYDDDTVETGYGFVPSAKWGAVVQKFDRADFPSGYVDQVCVCWLRTRDVAEYGFSVVFYDDVGGRPAEKPFARVRHQAVDVVKGKENAGRVDAFDVGGVPVPEGPFYIGVRWNPSKAPFTFVCADHTGREVQPTAGFQREDRARGWDEMLKTKDPIFFGHWASFIRATAKPEGWEPPPGTKIERSASSTPVVTPRAPTGETPNR
ncbi:MAG: hypothetical protein AAGE94_01805 [Acidobacteriota bacterium]